MENKVYLKKYLIISLIIVIIFLIIGNLFFYFQYKTYTDNYNEKIKGITSLLIEKYDVNPNEIVSILNEEKNYNDVFKEYGIDDSESLILVNDKMFIIFMIIFNLILISLFICLIVTYLNKEKKINKEIAKIVKCIEEINKQNYQIDLDENTEDELSILKNEIYKTTIMLKEAAINSKNDKLKLKDSLSDISHQIRTPLTSISILLDNILDDKDMDSKTKDEFMGRIKREIMNINSLVNELLKLSKFDASVIKFENKDVSLKDIVNSSITNTEMMAELKNVKIIVEGSSGKINCDFNWQVEAITNILKNCIEHSYENSKIIIKLKTNKVYSSITINDFGKGINKKDLPHIFERFYKGKNSSNDSIGIGLALAKTIIEENNGTISVNSIEGEKTTFTIKYYK